MSLPPKQAQNFPPHQTKQCATQSTGAAQHKTKRCLSHPRLQSRDINKPKMLAEGRQPVSANLQHHTQHRHNQLLLQGAGRSDRHCSRAARRAGSTRWLGALGSMHTVKDFSTPAQNRFLFTVCRCQNAISREQMPCLWLYKSVQQE